MNAKTILVIVSSAPYEGSDVVWNALRFAESTLENQNNARIFLINEGVDTGRGGLKPPDNFFNLAEMLRDIANMGADVKYCKTCIDRCGIGTGEMIEEIKVGSMKDLHDWVVSSEKVVTF